jgi:hypothetical protein
MALRGTGGARVSIERGVVEVRREEERKGGKRRSMDGGAYCQLEGWST